MQCFSFDLAHIEFSFNALPPVAGLEQLNLIPIRQRFIKGDLLSKLLIGNSRVIDTFYRVDIEFKCWFPVVQMSSDLP